MHSSHARLAATISVGLLIAAACTSASTGAPDMTPTASPSITITAATASPTAAATPASPSPASTPQPTPEPTPVPVPPKPTGVTFYEEMDPIGDGQVVELTQTVTWGAPRSEGVEIRVYGVTECIAEPADAAPGDTGPCLVVHTPLPASVRRLLATAPASAGAVSWTWSEEEGCDPSPFRSAPDGPGYHAVVLAAYSAAGNSIFAIAEPGGWWRAAPGDIVC